MNDLSLPRSDDLERDRRVVDLVIGGKRVDDVAQMMACTVANVESGPGSCGSGVSHG